MRQLQNQAGGACASATSAEPPLARTIEGVDESGMEEIEGDEIGMEEEGNGSGMEEEGNGSGMEDEEDEENEENANESEEDESEGDENEMEEEGRCGLNQHNRTIYFGPLSSMPDEQMEGPDASHAMSDESSGVGPSTGRDKGEDNEQKKDVVSLHILRAAYFVLKTTMARDGLKSMIEFLVMCGGDWGDNPSAVTDSEMPRIREAFGDAVLHFVAGHVDRSPCVSWVVDRVTVDGRWLDIMALVALVPEADAGDMIQSFVIGVPVIERYEDSAYLASLWAEIAARFGITDANKLASVCAGGDFHPEGVPTKFLAELAASNANGTQSSEPPLVPCLWDGAHLTDLADKAARAEESCPWVDDTVKTIRRLIKHLSVRIGWPKPWFDTDWLDLPFSALHLWSDTRYESPDGNILEQFTLFIRRITDCVRAQLDEPETDTDLPGLESDLQLLTGPDKNLLLVRVAALTDIYGVLGRACKTLRSLNLLPWERQAIVKEMVEKLGLMKATLRALSQDSASGSCSNSSVPGQDPSTSVQNSPTSDRDSAASIQDSSVPSQSPGAGDNQETVRGSSVEVTNGDDLQARWPTLAKHARTLTTEQVAEMLTFLEVLSEHCSEREKGTDRQGATKGSQNKKLVDAMDDIRAVADLQSLRRSESPDVLQTAQAALRRLESGHIIPATDINNDGIKATYDAIKRTKEGLSNQEVFKELWKAAKTQPELKLYVDTVTRLWLISPAEAVVESMAIAAKEIFDDDRELRHGAAATELIVRWNGPELGSDLARYVQEKHQFDFSSVKEGTTAEGESAANAPSAADARPNGIDAFWASLG